MAKNRFHEVEALVRKLVELIENEHYEEAQGVMLQLDTSIRALTHDDLLSLTSVEQAYLYEVASWLSDDNGEMAQRSKQLINAIAPLNENSPLKANKKYQVKSVNG